jgi:hypothetical protein
MLQSLCGEKKSIVHYDMPPLEPCENGPAKILASQDSCESQKSCPFSDSTQPHLASLALFVSLTPFVSIGFVCSLAYLPPPPHGQLCCSSGTYCTTGVVIKDGGLLRRARREVYIKRGVTKNHEDCVIAVVNGDLSVEAWHEFMHQISQYIVVEAQ